MGTNGSACSSGSAFSSFACPEKHLVCSGFVAHRTLWRSLVQLRGPISRSYSSEITIRRILPESCGVASLSPISSYWSTTYPGSECFPHRWCISKFRNPIPTASSMIFFWTHPSIHRNFSAGVIIYSAYHVFAVLSFLRLTESGTPN